MYDYPVNDDDAHEWDQAEDMASEAFDLYEKGKMRQALEKLSSAIELAPGHSEWYFNAALALDGLEDYEQAIEYYELALKDTPDDVEILNCLGVNYTRTTRYDLALETFERIESLDPGFEPGYCNRIIAYTEMEQHDKAEQMFYLAQQIDPDCPLCFYNIGNSLFTQGKYDRAIWCWDKCAELDVKHPQIHFRLAQACWVSGRGTRARAEFLAELRQNPSDVEVILDFGLFLLESGDLEGAKEKFNRILEFDETFAHAQFYLGEVCRMQGNLSAAERWYRRTMETDSRLCGPRFRLAGIYQKTHQTETAAKLLIEEFSLGIEDADVLGAIGWMLINMDAGEEAIRCFLQVLEQDDGNADVYFGLAVSLAMGGEYAGALQSLKRAMRLKPDQPELLLCAGWVCCQRRRWAHALYYVRKCQAVYPEQEPWRSRCRELKRTIILSRFIAKIKAGRWVRWFMD